VKLNLSIDRGVTLHLSIDGGATLFFNMHIQTLALSTYFPNITCPKNIGTTNVGFSATAQHPRAIQLQLSIEAAVIVLALSQQC